MPKSIFFLTLALISLAGAAAAGGGSNSSSPCIPQMLPCQPYLKNPSNPPVSCCMPLNKVIDTELPCLCAVFNDTAIMRSFNVTRMEAIVLATNCGVKSAGNLCPNDDHSDVPGASPTTPSSTPPATAAPPQHVHSGVGQSTGTGILFIAAAAAVFFMH